MTQKPDAVIKHPGPEHRAGCPGVEYRLAREYYRHSGDYFMECRKCGAIEMRKVGEH